jgi:hypothetical protein
LEPDSFSAHLSSRNLQAAGSVYVLGFGFEVDFYGRKMTKTKAKTKTKRGQDSQQQAFSRPPFLRKHHIHLKRKPIPTARL